MPGGALLSLACAVFLTLAPACGLAAPADAAQQDAASPVDALLDDVIRLREEGRAAEAEPLARRAVEAAEQAFGPDHPHTAVVLAELAGTLHELGRAEEAERLYRRVLGIVEAAVPQESHDLATALNNLAEALAGLNRLDEAEAMHRRALAINERVLPAGAPDIATSLNNLAGVLQRMSRLDEAEALFRSALAIREQGLDDADVALTLTNLAVVLQHLNRLDDAESLHRRALAVYELALPPNHPTIAASLNNLAAVLWNLGRLDEAEKLHRRGLAIREAVLPAGHPDIALSLSNLAVVLQNLRRYDEAEALHRRALALYEAALPQGHPDIAASLNNLAMTLQPQERFEEAAALHRRALAIREAALPADHPLVALSLSNLASVLQNLGSMDEAEAMHRRALAIQERALPQNHPDIAQGLENLALFLGAWKNDFAEAAVLLDRSARIFAAPENRASVTHRGWRERAFFRNAFGEGRFYDVGEAAVGDLRAGRRGAFVDLQWERSGGAGGAIAAAMARAQAAPEVAALARRRDGLLAEVHRLDDAFLAASSDTAADAAARAARLAELRTTAETARRELAAADAEIARRFPAYAELSQALPLEVDDLVQLLAPDEVLVTIVPFDAQGFFFAYGREGGRFAPLADAAGVAEMGRRLRCSAAYGLDPACAALPVASAGDGAPATAADARSATPLGASIAPSRAVFDLDLAHALYRRLFPEEMRDFLRGRKLIVAPAPELVGLPWHLLVAEPPPAGWNAPGADRARAYREAGWLFREHPSITVLPTVAALRALRGAAPERGSADRAFLGIGDPVIGRDDAERDAPPMRCATDLRQVALARSAAEGPAAVFAGERDAAGFALADPARVRGLSRLPDTRCELLSVAASLGEGDGALLLGRDASEARIRALDRAGELARYRVLHFATHGLLGGELGLGEPGLVLTPPGQASAEDDGILSAGEIAALTLTADWVVLSACNTAAGSEADAEALSGLARSFFYAGARSLLVSSWPVYSPAAVELTTRAFAAMAADPALDRGEALTLAMRDTLAGTTSEFTAHPAYWAPFLLVGEGGR